MVIPRKPKRKTDNEINTFINSALAKTENQREKTGKVIISISFSESDSEWLDITLKELNSKTARKITRTEIISAALGLLKEKKLEKILRLLQRR